MIFQWNKKQTGIHIFNRFHGFPPSREQQVKAFINQSITLKCQQIR